MSMSSSANFMLEIFCFMSKGSVLCCWCCVCLVYACPKMWWNIFFAGYWSRAYLL